MMDGLTIKVVRSGFVPADRTVVVVDAVEQRTHLVLAVNTADTRTDAQVGEWLQALLQQLQDADPTLKLTATSEPTLFGFPIRTMESIDSDRVALIRCLSDASMSFAQATVDALNAARVGGSELYK